MEVTLRLSNAIWGGRRLVPHENQARAAGTRKPPAFDQQALRVASGLSIGKTKGRYGEPGLERQGTAWTSIWRPRHSTKGERVHDGHDDVPILTCRTGNARLATISTTRNFKSWYSAWVAASPPDAAVTEADGSSTAAPAPTPQRKRAQPNKQKGTGTVKRHQRQVGRRNQDRGSNSDDEDDDPLDRPNRDTDNRGAGPKTQPTLYFACPFYKLDPHRHFECMALQLTDPCRVRQHLQRTHSTKVIHHCPMCGMYWAKKRDGSEEEWESHIQRGGCQRDNDGAQDGRFHEYITKDEFKALKRLKIHKGDHGRQWYQIWDFFFPGHDRPSSPYIKSGLAEPVDVLRKGNEPPAREKLRYMLRDAPHSEASIEEKVDEIMNLCYSTQSPRPLLRRSPQRPPAAGDGAVATPIVAQPRPYRTHDNIHYNALPPTSTFSASGPPPPPVAFITGPLNPQGQALIPIPPNAYDYQLLREPLITENSEPACQYNPFNGMLTPEQCVSALQYGGASVQQSAGLVVPSQPTHSTNPMLAQGQPGHNFNYWDHVGDGFVENFPGPLDFSSMAPGQDWVQGNTPPILQSDPVTWSAPPPVTAGTASVTTQTTKEPLRKNNPQPLGPSIPQHFPNILGMKPTYGYIEPNPIAGASRTGSSARFQPRSNF